MMDTLIIQDTFEPYYAGRSQKGEPADKQGPRVRDNRFGKDVDRHWQPAAQPDVRPSGVKEH